MTYRSSKDQKMREVTKAWKLLIPPIGWAFAIWGIIYMFNLMFVVYMVLPCSWVPLRNNDLIFGQIGYLFSINMLTQGAWLIVWLKGTPTAMLIAGAINFYMLSNGLVILQYAMYANLSMYEIISLRAGFSLYCGWVAAANIVNVAYVLKSSGFGSKDTELMWS